MENRLPLTFVPKQYTTYFINSKRRFFLYFKYRDQMNQVIKIFEKENVRFHQRKSIFPDREQQQEIVFHCNYKYKKKDLRWSLARDTRFRQPINKFYQKKFENLKEAPPPQNCKQPSHEPDSVQMNSLNKELPNSKYKIQPKAPNQMQMQQTSIEYAADFGEVKIKNPEVLDLINNLEFVKALFKLQKRK